MTDVSKTCTTSCVHPFRCYTWLYINLVSSEWPASLHYCNIYLYCALTIFTQLYIYLTHLTDRGLLHHSDRYRHPAWQEDRRLLPHLAQHWSVQIVKIKCTKRCHSFNKIMLRTKYSSLSNTGNTNNICTYISTLLMLNDMKIVHLRTFHL